ncbi:MAG: hypothetical protein IPI73_18240 [Betaproteobacteria bacterium]|nr:hypothetical protein [Betaproteobacteria bacterium]
MFKVWGDFSMLRTLVPFAGRGFGEGVAHPDPTSELECCTGLLVCWLLTQPGDPRNGELAERMFALLVDPAVHPTARLVAAGVLPAQCQLAGNTSRGIATRADAGAELDNERIPLEHRLMWSYEAALFSCLAPAPNHEAVAAELAAHRARSPGGIATACVRLRATGLRVRV